MLRKSAKFGKIFQKLKVIAVQGHPRTLTLVSIESTCTTSYYLLIVTLDISPTVFNILMHLAQKQLFSHPTLALVEECHAISLQPIHWWKVHLIGCNSVA